MGVGRKHRTTPAGGSCRYLTVLLFVSPPQDLNLIDKESDDVLERIMDEKTASESKILYGHSGPVYGISFSPDRYHRTGAPDRAGLQSVQPVQLTVTRIHER